MVVDQLAEQVEAMDVGSEAQGSAPVADDVQPAAAEDGSSAAAPQTAAVVDDLPPAPVDEAAVKKAYDAIMAEDPRCVEYSAQCSNMRTRCSEASAHTASPRELHLWLCVRVCAVMWACGRMIPATGV